MGGPHPTFNKAVTGKIIDAVADGDTAFDGYVGRQKWRRLLVDQSFHGKYKGEIYKNGLAPLVDELDDLPYPDRDLLYDADQA